MSFLLNIVITSLFFSVLATSLNMISGFVGLFSIAHAAFFGIGAYTSAILLTHYGVPFILSLLAGIILSAICGILIGIPTLRLKGDYLLIATLGFGEIVQSIFKNWASVTGGPSGISRIPAPYLLGITFDSEISYIVLLICVLVLTISMAWSLKHSPLGLVLRGIAEDEILLTSLGRNPYRHKVKLFAISSALAGGCGALYASYMTYISPGNFLLTDSILILAIVIFGGLGSITGPVIGAFVLVLLPETLRFVGLPADIAANSRQIIYGILLILIMRYRPNGLMGDFKI